ncbi:hypothetical protein ACSFA3_06265 [Variovorax sp. RHLX14]|uniref:hypothetical protein n=1 Tax=Variovorax sp. RHLX14 TaxID=1259731 RepID=UPI003F48DF87
MTAATLVVVVYLAGASWGPQMTLHDLSDVKACRSMQTSVAQVILKTVKTNTTGGIVNLSDIDEDVVLETASGREVARLTCIAASGKS